MPYCLAPAGSAKTLGTVKRFDARYWTVNFPRPMMAGVVTTGAVVSVTTTLNGSLVPVFPATSVAEQVSVVVPTGNAPPEA